MATFWQRVMHKLNPAQPRIAHNQGQQSSNQNREVTLASAYQKVETVNRCVNMIVDSASQVGFDIQDPLPFVGMAPGMKKASLVRCLNHRPNPFMDISTFWRLLLMDFLMDGNAFIHFDGANLYHLPAKNMTIIPDARGYINSYRHEDLTLNVKEVIHIKDNSFDSVIRGRSRLNAALNSILRRETMLDFQESFFNNGAVVGLVVETDQILGKKLRERQELEWQHKYNPRAGSSKPLILDAGMKVKETSNTNFREMMFMENIDGFEDKIAKAMGVPKVLLESGNNANLRPNVELFFSMTVIPLMRKFESAFEAHFAFDIQLTTHNISALAPDLKLEADRISSLVNNGIITGNEGRANLRLDPLDDEDMENIRIPANIAGSATGVTGQEGGAPAQQESEN